MEAHHFSMVGCEPHGLTFWLDPLSFPGKSSMISSYISSRSPGDVHKNAWRFHQHRHVQDSDDASSGLRVWHGLWGPPSPLNSSPETVVEGIHYTYLEHIWNHRTDVVLFPWDGSSNLQIETAEMDEISTIWSTTGIAWSRASSTLMENGCNLLYFVLGGYVHSIIMYNI